MLKYEYYVYLIICNRISLNGLISIYKHVQRNSYTLVLQTVIGRNCFIGNLDRRAGVWEMQILPRDRGQRRIIIILGTAAALTRVNTTNNNYFIDVYCELLLQTNGYLQLKDLDSLCWFSDLEPFILRARDAQILMFPGNYFNSTVHYLTPPNQPLAPRPSRKQFRRQMSHVRNSCNNNVSLRFQRKNEKTIN